MGFQGRGGGGLDRAEKGTLVTGGVHACGEARDQLEVVARHLRAGAFR